MERSDEARRLGCLYDRLNQKNRKIRELETENKKLKTTMELHAGDCCSLNNEVELFRGHWEDAEERVKQLELQLKEKDELLFAYESVRAPVKENAND